MTPDKIPEVKIKVVKRLVEQISKAKTLMIVSIKGLPSKQFQDIKKSVREYAIIKVAKKNIMLRALKELKKESILPLEKHISENCAFVISGMEGYELAGILSQKKTPVYAKAGQIAPEDIEVKAGPTDLVPGPAISELGNLGIQVAVEEGKISIKAPKIIVKKDQEISENAASILQKLDIQPFTIGLEPIAIYDVESEKIYTDIKIDFEETATELRNATSKALGFAQKIVYLCKDTIGYLLAKANSEGDALGKLSSSEENTSNATEDKGKSEEASETREVKEEKAKEEKKEAVEEKPKEENVEEKTE